MTPLLATDELAFDTRHGPFTDPRLRRAASYALDRPTLAAALGDLVTDRYLPPGMPALRDRHVSPLTGPDLRRARALAGPRTGRVVLAVCSDPGCLRLGQIIQADLEHIGLHIKLRPYAGAIASATSPPGADIVLARVFGPYPDPVAFLRTALGGRFAQDRLDKIARLDRRQRLAAAGQLELQLMRGQAPLAAFGTPAIPEFFSARVSCHIFQPLQFGADLGSLACGAASPCTGWTLTSPRPLHRFGETVLRPKRRGLRIQLTRKHPQEFVNRRDRMSGSGRPKSAAPAAATRQNGGSGARPSRLSRHSM